MAPFQREERLERSAITRRAGRPLAALLAAALLAATVPIGYAEQERSVFYLVTYEDGRIRRHPAAPTTSQGVAKVLRIARARRTTVGTMPSTAPATPSVYIEEMTWNGAAWAAPARPATAPSPRDRRRQDELRRMNASLLDLAGKLLASQDALAVAERQADRAGRDAAEAATRAARQELLRSTDALAEARKKLAESTAARKAAEDEARKARDALAIVRKESVGAARAAAETLRAQTDASTKRLAAATADRDRDRGRADAAGKALAEAKTALAEAEKKLALATASAESLRADLAAGEELLATTTADRDQARGDADEAQRALAAAREAAGELLADAEAARKGALAELAALRKEVSAASTRPAATTRPAKTMAMTPAEIVVVIAVVAAGALLIVAVLLVMSFRRRGEGSSVANCGEPPQDAAAEVMGRLWALRVSPGEPSDAPAEPDAPAERALGELRDRLEELASRAEAEAPDGNELRREIDALRTHAAEAMAAAGRQVADNQRRRLQRDLLAYLLALDVPRTVQDVLLAMAVGSPFRLTAAELVAAARALADDGLIDCSGPADDWRTTMGIPPDSRERARQLAFGSGGR